MSINCLKSILLAEPKRVLHTFSIGPLTTQLNWQSFMFTDSSPSTCRSGLSRQPSPWLFIFSSDPEIQEVKWPINLGLDVRGRSHSSLFAHVSLFRRSHPSPRIHPSVPSEPAVATSKGSESVGVDDHLGAGPSGSLVSAAGWRHAGLLLSRHIKATVVGGVPGPLRWSHGSLKSRRPMKLSGLTLKTTNASEERSSLQHHAA